MQSDTLCGVIANAPGCFNIPPISYLRLLSVWQNAELFVQLEYSDVHFDSMPDQWSEGWRSRPWTSIAVNEFETVSGRLSRVWFLFCTMKKRQLKNDILYLNSKVHMIPRHPLPILWHNRKKNERRRRNRKKRKVGKIIDFDKKNTFFAKIYFYSFVICWNNNIDLNLRDKRFLKINDQNKF